MKSVNYLLICFFITFVSCSTKKSQEKQILGKWKMEKVYEGEQEVTAIHNPKNNRWIKFNRNGSFESGGDPYGYNDGTWELDLEKSILFIDSKTEGDDSEWNVTFEEDKLIWTGIGTPRQESFKIINRKVE